MLAAPGMRQSMSRRGDCRESAVAERFLSTLEHELLAGAAFATRAEAHRALTEFVVWYNAERRHSTLNYLSPKQYERRLADTPRTA